MLARIMMGILVLGALVRAEGVDPLEDAIEGYLAQEPEKDPMAWKASVGLGIQVTTGNSESQTVAFTADASKDWEKWKLKLGLLSTYQRQEGVESASEHIFTERVDYKLGERGSIFQSLALEHDEAEFLTLRAVLTVGYKRILVKKEKFELSAEAGAGGLYEDFRNLEDNKEAIAHLGLDWTWKITEHLTFEQIFRVYPSLSDSGEFLATSLSTFTTPLSERVSLKLTILDRYDSDAVAPTKENDLTVALTLNAEF